MFVTCLVTGASPKWSWFLVPVLIFFQFILSIGATLIAARATSMYGDVKNILPFLFRLLFYGSGVLFSVDAYVTNDLLCKLFIANPMFDILEIYRWAILGGQVSYSEVLALAIWVILLLSIGVSWFRRGEAAYGI